jgi:hypothetical protein
LWSTSATPRILLRSSPLKPLCAPPIFSIPSLHACPRPCSGVRCRSFLHQLPWVHPLQGDLLACGRLRRLCVTCLALVCGFGRWALTLIPRGSGCPDRLLLFDGGRRSSMYTPREPRRNLGIQTPLIFPARAFFISGSFLPCPRHPYGGRLVAFGTVSPPPPRMVYPITHHARTHLWSIRTPNLHPLRRNLNLSYQFCRDSAAVSHGPP